MKSTQELNDRWWYRLIKVFYLLFLVSFLLLSPVSVFFNYSPQYNNDSSYIHCANGIDFILSKNGITLYNDFMSGLDQERARDLCFDGVKKNTLIGGTHFQVTVPEVVSETENSGKYMLISEYTKRDWIATIFFSLLSILSVLFFFELIRRIFYYIILGSVRPRKNGDN